MVVLKVHTWDRKEVFLTAVSKHGEKFLEENWTWKSFQGSLQSTRRGELLSYDFTALNTPGCTQISIKYDKKAKQFSSWPLDFIPTIIQLYGWQNWQRKSLLMIPIIIQRGVQKTVLGSSSIITPPALYQEISSHDDMEEVLLLISSNFWKIGKMWKIGGGLKKS